MPLLHHMTYPQAREAGETHRRGAELRDSALARGTTLFQPPQAHASFARQRLLAAGRNHRRRSPPAAADRTRAPARQRAKAKFSPSAGRQRLLAAYPALEEPLQNAYAAFPTTPRSPSSMHSPPRRRRQRSGNTREHADESANDHPQVDKNNPDHPGAMHYLVHANDVPARARFSSRSLCADGTVLNNPHAFWHILKRCMAVHQLIDNKSRTELR